MESINIFKKKLFQYINIQTPDSRVVDYKTWQNIDQLFFFEKLKKELGLPLVIKPSLQGSSIGVYIVRYDNFQDFIRHTNKAFFCEKLSIKTWNIKNHEQKKNYVDDLSDLRNGLGLPLDLYVDHKKEEVFTPEQLYDKIQHYFNQDKDSIFLKSWHCESRVVFERFIDGKEFSCIVIENTENNPVALPPTEIIKKTRIYDYRSKYLSGISRKITPIDLPSKKIEEIRTSCMNLYKKLNFKVYARIDGILANDGTIYLNDPNTTSGMLPSSFFFHQAAEIGLNPSDFLTYILHTSLKKHIQNGSCERTSLRLKNQLENSLKLSRKSYNKKLKVALFFGGSSYERHISVESARNIYEKLAASDKYLPVPIFVKGIEKGYELYKISINLLLKDNADDISHRINSLEHPIIQNIRIACQNLTTYYSTQKLSHAQKINYNQLKEEVDFVFIAMHGRPGEDGQIQTELEKINLPYNGSSAKAAQVMINKYLTNEILKENGILIAKHTLISRVEWLHESELF